MTKPTAPIQTLVDACAYSRESFTEHLMMVSDHELLGERTEASKDELLGDANRATRRMQIGIANLVWDAAESPIERRVWIAIAFMAVAVNRDSPAISFSPSVPDFPAALKHHRETEGRNHPRSLICTPQAGFPEMRARVDGVLWRGDINARPIVLEIDGYEWHRDKFTSDRQRDRAFHAAGYDIVRFSGSEVNNDMARVAADLMRRIGDLLEVPGL